MAQQFLSEPPFHRTHTDEERIAGHATAHGLNEAAYALIIVRPGRLL